MLTARTTAAPATGPELVKSRSGARVFEEFCLIHESCRHFRRRLRSRRGLRAVGNAVTQCSLRRDAELREDGDAGTHDRAHGFGEISRAVEFDHVGAAFLDQANGGA